MKISKRTIIITFAVIAVFFGIFAGVIIGYFAQLPPVEELMERKPSLSTKLYDCNANLITQVYVEQRSLIPLSQVPEIMQKAIVATEDERFFKHWGIDPKAIMRAFLKNVFNIRVVQGASTITQQLARDLFLTRKKTVARKLKEALLAIKIEHKYTKKEILEMYLNQIYFGSGAYGIEAAARTYFGKHVENLTLTDCALLAALPRGPNVYSPYKNPDKAKNRRDSILTRLSSQGIITKEEEETAKKEPIQLAKIELRQAPYFVEYVRQYLESVYGPHILYKGGLTVQTTLDLPLQEKAQILFDKAIQEAQIKADEATGKTASLSAPKLQGCMLAIAPQTGQIKVMIGGRDFKESEFNRTVQAKRQPGSAFKPFIYTAAIDNGFTPATILMDAPEIFKDADGKEWKPQNYEQKFFGPTPLRDAIAYSRNVSTVKLLTRVGLGTVINYTRRMGITSNLRHEYTLALGASEVSLIELVSAFAIFPNNGIKVDPIGVVSVQDRDNNIIEENSPHFTEVLKPETAYIMVNLLQSVIEYGTAKSAKDFIGKLPAAGKTGTTDENTDVWFIGFTPDLVVGIWIGYDEKISMGKWATSANLAVPLWAEFMKQAYEGKQPQQFFIPSNIVEVLIDSESGMLASPLCKKTRKEIFVKGLAPVEYCNIHKKSSGL